MLIPRFLEFFFVLPNYTLQLVQLMRREPFGSSQAHWFEPELCHLPILPNMNVWRFAPFVAKEEEAIRADPSDIRHSRIVARACRRRCSGRDKFRHFHFGSDPSVALLYKTVPVGTDVFIFESQMRQASVERHSDLD
jgi:hypothetical protein